jgi:hypothetical protein
LAFLGGGRFTATIAGDDASNPAALKMDRRAASAPDVLTFDLRPGGGFVARLSGV